MFSPLQETPFWDVLIIGGGPAGFFAAIRCTEINPKARVLILEKSSQVLGKVRISGGGRCNLTHACYDPAQLVEFYPRGGRELRGAFTRFQPADTCAWFERHAVPLKTEADGRVFPQSDRSESIVNCLVEVAAGQGVAILTRVLARLVRRVEPEGIFEVEVDGGESLRSRRLLLASGGSRGALQLAQALGHTVVPPVPSLFTFTLNDPRLEGLAGVSVDEATLRLPAFGIEQSGSLLITHWGLSGPAALKLSAWGARPLHSAGYAADLTVNWLPGLSENELSGLLQKNIAHAPKHHVTARPFPDNHPSRKPLPLRLWRRLAAAAGIDETLTWGNLSHAQAARLADELVQGHFRICGKGVFKEEFVTCGGVSLKEVDFKTLQSRICPGLFFAGEVLDIDAVTGGFNFQSAWTTAWLAGMAMAAS